MPNLGIASHGFEEWLTGISPGVHTVYIYALDSTGIETNSVEFSGTVTVKTINSRPYGALDTIEGGAEAIHIAGWAIDDDEPNKPLQIHIHVTPLSA